MRRTTAAVAGTLSGAALLLAAKFGTGAVAAPVASDQAADETGGLTPSPAPSSGAPQTGTSQNGAPRTGAPQAGPSQGGAPQGGASQASNGLKNGTFRGNAVRNQYGPIQVTIQVANGRITGLTATHATSPAMTVQVNERAIPLLRQQTLQAQSTRIDGVSGATFTSGSFRTSLQSALTVAKT